MQLGAWRDSFSRDVMSLLSRSASEGITRHLQNALVHRATLLSPRVRSGLVRSPHYKTSITKIWRSKNNYSHSQQRLQLRSHFIEHLRRRRCNPLAAALLPIGALHVIREDNALDGQPI